MHKLTAIAIKRLPPGKHEDGGGLRLVKRQDGGGQWVFRYTCHGRRREMGLGGLRALSLKEARERAAHYRGLVAQDIDPIGARRRLRAEAIRNRNMLRDVALDAFESRKSSLRGDGVAGRWFSPPNLPVLPKLGRVPVAEINARDIRDVLQPIWHTKASTAAKAITRLGIVLQHAAALELDVDLQAVPKAKALLGAQKHKVTAVPSMPWQEVPGFYATLQDPSPVNLALRLLILTGLRSLPVRFARVDEIEGDIWTVPADKMKGRRGKVDNFRVPLTPEALRVIELARMYEWKGYLFHARKTVISDATMSRMMERRGLTARPHGFRASLRTWLAEETEAPHEVAEAMLAHVSDSKVVRSYRRTDFLDQRRTLLERWATHCLSGTVTSA